MPREHRQWCIDAMARTALRGTGRVAPIMREMATKVSGMATALSEMAPTISGMATALSEPAPALSGMAPTISEMATALSGMAPTISEMATARSEMAPKGAGEMGRSPGMGMVGPIIVYRNRLK